MPRLAPSFLPCGSVVRNRRDVTFTLSGLLDCFGKRGKKKGRQGGMVPAPALLPDDVIVYAVGDIHGHSALLRRLLDRIFDHAATFGQGRRAVLVFLGDYVDRGPDSRGAVDLVMHPPPGFTVRALMGNHEQAMLDFIDDPEKGQQWIRWSPATLASYGLEGEAQLAVGAGGRRLLRDRLVAALPPAHLAFYRGLETMVDYGGYAFVHAGVRPGVPLAAQIPEDLIWIREPFLDWPAPFEKVIVHGHSINGTPVIRRNRIGIDTGAYASGILTALALCGDSMDLIQAGKRSR